MSSATIIVYGFVQGVGYRKFVRHEAEERGLTGWVRNLPDNTVEAALSGEKEKVEEVIEACKKGPFLSEVEDVAVTWEKDPQSYQGFIIRHDLD